MKNLFENKEVNHYGRRSGSMPSESTKEIKKASQINSMNKSMVQKNVLSSPKL